MQFITAIELSKCKTDGVVILDIRDNRAYSKAHIKDSLQIDIYGHLKLGNTDFAKKKLLDLPKDKTIITICNAGITAQKASELLEEMGYNSKVLEGGIIKWSEKFPLETS